MTKFAGLLLVLFLTVSLRAEGLLAVATADGSTIWAAGPSGLILRSMDGGSTWGSVTLDSTTLRAAAAAGPGVWLAGDGGILHCSSDGGAAWTTSVIGGGQTIHALSFVSSLRGWAAGEGGTVTVTTDGGATWAPQTSGTSVRLRTIWFRDSLTGFAGGAGGVLLSTTNGGAIWTPAGGPGWTAEIAALHGSGSVLIAVGADGFARRSTNSGTSWTPLTVETDSRSDLTAVRALSAGAAVLAVGGGALWTTTDGGATFSFGVHPMHAPLHALAFHDTLHGWAVTPKNNAVLRTTDGGATWSLPAGTTVSLNWNRRLIENSSIGNTFVIAPWNPEVLYVALGDSIYRSTDTGETWTYRSRVTTGPGSTHSFYISPKDSNLWVVAHTGGGDAVKRSTNGGVTWTTTLQRNFTSYGMPLEMDPDHPDTLLFAPDGTGSGGSDANGILYRSTNFGLTWDTLAATGFRSPCDIVIVPGNSSIVYVGDGITGSGRGRFWLSEDAGSTWALIDSVTGSEIPTVTASRVRNTEAFHTAWGSGGIRKTVNLGKNWSQVATTSSTWGVDVAKDDPNVVLFGVYGGGTTYLSTNGGATFPAGLQSPLTGSNYAILAYDRGTFLAQQSGGVYKLRVTYTVPVSNIQSLAVTAPNGGEVWAYGTVHPVTWSSSNVAAVRIELALAPGGPWQTVIASTPGPAGSYAWTIPDAPATQARIRVSDAGDGSPVDTSNGVFSITVPSAALTPGALVFDTTAVGAARLDTVRITNGGTAPLVITSVTGSTGAFTAGRTSLTIPAGSSDTLSVRFTPAAAGGITDTLVLANNSPVPGLRLPVAGTGVVTGPLTVGVVVETGWNMISLPVLPADARVAQVFPQAASPAFAYAAAAGYLPQDTLTPGRGYWLKFDSAFTAGVTGLTLPAETVDVERGWNMIGALTTTVDSADIITEPAGILGSSFYGYAAGYSATRLLEPGNAYWVKAAAAGRLVLVPAAVLRNSRTVPSTDGR